jgi:probable HAF family extracellular repeat protein
MTDIGTLSAYDWSYGTAINASGQITGYAFFSGSGIPDHAFLYSNGTMIDLGTLNGPGGTAEGFGINASGQVVGSSYITAGNPHAFLYSNGTMTDLGTLGGVNSIANGINASGQVTGRADRSNGTTGAFLYSGGMMLDIGTLGGDHSFGTGINDSGQIVGYSYLAGNAVVHAFLANCCANNNYIMVDLGSLGGVYSRGFAVNSLSQVVGYSVLADGSTVHGFLYTSGTGMVDLNSLLPNGSGWELSVGESINDAGQIVGVGYHNGVSRAFLMIPPQLTCLPVRPVAKDIIQDYGNIPPWSKNGLPHTGIDYRSPLGNAIPSVGPNGVIYKFHYCPAKCRRESVG